MYCNDMELSEGQDATWCKIRSVVNPKSASYNYLTLQRWRWDKDKISDYDRETGDICVPVGRGLYQRNGEQCFQRGGKDVELDQPIARPRLNFQKVIRIDPDIHPDRIRFSEVTDILGKVNTRKACSLDHITNKITRYLIPMLHLILQDLFNICVLHGYQGLCMDIDGPQIIRPCSYRLVSLLCCLSKVFEAIMTKQ